MTSYCQPAVLLLYKGIRMLTLSYLQTRRREGRDEAERIFGGNYGTTWAHQRVRKEEASGLRCKEGY